MLVNDIINYCNCTVIVEDNEEENILYTFNHGYSTDIPFDIAIRTVKKIYAENDKLFITVCD